MAAAGIFRINPDLDERSAAARFAASGRVHIPDFLVREDAERLFDFVRGSAEWRLVVNQGEKLFELDRSAQVALTPEAHTALARAAHEAARYNFQFLYEAVRVPDDERERERCGNALARFASFLSSADVVPLLRRVTGAHEIEFADAQATAYGPGHFLTAHDDDVAGKRRHAAYVFNLTPVWRVDWGGLLLFHGPDGHVPQAYVPSFNALNLFAVPQPHSVSLVAPFAANRRYSVTGWLRSGNGADQASAPVA
jgi:Rps23 Pro-64 3,4-dihydroxylase Tpa1-like proline 4-hydroxylase